MKYVIPGIHLKVFARATQSLGRIGEELYVEPCDIGVSFRTVNSSRSAFASFTFKQSFFSVCDSSSCEDDIKCKVSMKAFTNIFRSIGTSDRLVEKCKLHIDPAIDTLIVVLTMHHGISKIYNLSFIECESLQAVFNTNEYKYHLTSQSHMFCDALTNFHSNHDEVTISVTPEKAYITNYLDSDADMVKAIHTELTLSAEEFDKYNVTEKAEVTFCLKEVKSLLTFTEPSNIPVSLNFYTPGKPIIFSIENNTYFEVNFVLATLATEDTDAQCKDKNTSINTSQNIAISKSPREPGSSHKSSNVVKRRMSPNGNINNLFVNNTTPRKPAVNNPINDRSSIRTNYSTANDEVPGTPPSKKQRFFFQRCFDSTFNTSKISGFNNIHAEDSDEES